MYTIHVEGNIVAGDPEYVAEVIRNTIPELDVDVENDTLFLFADGMRYDSAEFISLYENDHVNWYIESGTIEFRGEDGSIWKDVYKDGGWVEYEGVVEWIGPHPV